MPESKTSVLSFRAPTIVKAVIVDAAEAAGKNLNQYLLDTALTKVAENAAARAGLPSPHQVSAEDEARRRWFCGDASSPDAWPACDAVLESMGPQFRNIDFRSALFHELYARRPEIAVAGFALSGISAELTEALIQVAFSELFENEPEAALDAFSVDDTCKLLLAENAGWATVVATNQNTQQLTSYCYSEAERAGVAGRRAHSRRILRSWRERGIAWPDIEIDRHGCPRLVDGLKIVLTPDAGRRVPTLVSAPRSAPDPEVHSVSPTPRPGQIGGSADVARDLALSRQSSAKIGGE